MGAFEILVVIALALIAISIWCLISVIKETRDEFAVEVASSTATGKQANDIKVVVDELKEFLGDEKHIAFYFRKFLNEYIGSHDDRNITERLEVLEDDSADLVLLVCYIASQMGIALPTHHVGMLEIDEELEAKLVEDNILTVFQLDKWLNDDSEDDIPGIGTKEKKVLKKALKGYFEVFTAQYLVEELPASPS